MDNHAETIGVKEVETYFGNVHEASCVFNSEQLDRIDRCLSPNSGLADISTLQQRLSRWVSSLNHIFFSTICSQLKHRQYIVNGARNECWVTLQLHPSHIVIMTLLKSIQGLLHHVEIPDNDILVSANTEDFRVHIQWVNWVFWTVLTTLQSSVSCECSWVVNLYCAVSRATCKLSGWRVKSCNVFSVFFL